jgi:hypothetical protein
MDAAEIIRLLEKPTKDRWAGLLALALPGKIGNVPFQLSFWLETAVNRVSCALIVEEHCCLIDSTTSLLP